MSLGAFYWVPGTPNPGSAYTCTSAPDCRSAHFCMTAAGFSAMAISQSPSSFLSSAGQLTQCVGTGFCFPNSGDTGCRVSRNVARHLMPSGHRGTEKWTGIPACGIHCFFAWGPFFTTNYLSQVKQICKSHSLWANSLCRDSQLSVKMGFTFKGSASASSLCTCPYIIPTFWTSPKEWVSTYLTSAWPKSQLCFPEKWENLPEGKRKSRKHTRMQKCLLVPKFWLYFCFDFVCYTRYLGLDFAFWLTLSLFSSKEAWFA